MISALPSLRDSLSQVLSSIHPVNECIEISAAADKRSVVATVLARKANPCFVDVGSDQIVGLELVRGLTASGLTVVALGRDEDADLILRSLRSGAVDVLFDPLSSEAVAAALSRLEERVPGARPSEPGRVFFALPSKPNHGSTTLACSLAVRAHQLGARKVLLADLDDNLGSVSFLLKLKAPFTFEQAFSQWNRMDEDLWKQLPVSYAGVDVLLAPEMSSADPLPGRDITATVAFLRNLYRASILDAANVHETWRAEFARLADSVLLTTTNELAAIHATRKMLAQLETIGCNRDKVLLIVNRYVPEKGLSRSAIERALKLNVFHILPNDYDSVQKAAFEGRPVSSTSAFAKSVDQLCRKLLPSHSQEQPAFRSGIWSLLSVLRKPQKRTHTPVSPADKVSAPQDEGKKENTW